MLTSRRLLVFVVLAIVAVAAALLLANQRSSNASADGALLYPELKAQADSVTAIRIFKAGDARALELIRDGADWRITEREGYPAAPVKARRLVQALAAAKVLEEKTSDPTKYSALSVEDVTATDAKGVRIAVEGPKTPVDLIVGKDGAGGKTSYVRRAGDKQSWHVNTQLSASPEIGDWLDKDLLNVSADRVQSASIAIEGEKPYLAAKASRADADFEVESLPKGKALNSPSAANTAASALTNLTLDDVQPKANIVASKPTARATYKTFDGLIVQLEGFKLDDKRFITIAPSYDETLAEQFKVKTAADEKPKDGAAAAKVAETKSDVANEAKTLAAKAEKWAYQIPDYKFDAIFRPLDEMLKK